MFCTKTAHAHQLKDLRGKSFAFAREPGRGRPLDAALRLERDGLRRKPIFGGCAILGSHEVRRAVGGHRQGGAGVLGGAGWQRLVDSDKLDLSEVRVLATTPASLNSTGRCARA